MKRGPRRPALCVLACALLSVCGGGADTVLARPNADGSRDAVLGPGGIRSTPVAASDLDAARMRHRL